MENIIKPQRLNKGDKVAIVSLAHPEAALRPKRLELAIANFQALGLEVVVMPHAIEQDQTFPYFASSDAHVVDDFHQALRDPQVKAIMAPVGGEGASRLLELIDYELIGKNPKIIVGFSDCTSLLLAIFKKAGLVTYHGPNFFSFALETVDPYTSGYFANVLFSKKEIVYQPAPFYSDILVGEDDLWQNANLDKKGGSWDFIRKGEAKGRLIGGNLERLLELSGTPFWPNFTNALMFWEDTWVKISWLHQKLNALRLTGVFAKIKGMIVGKVADKQGIWGDEGNDEWDEEIFRQMLLEVSRGYNFPILTQVDLGHTRPKITLPIGIEAKIRGDGAIELLEEPTVD